MRALIVEDDFTSRVLLQRLLAPYGESHTAVDGKEALEAFRLALASKEHYQLACLDVMMPEMDGQEVLRTLRKMEQDAQLAPGQECKVVMTTALWDAKNVTTAFKEQCDAYMVKPVDKTKLVECLVKLGVVPAP